MSLKASASQTVGPFFKNGMHLENGTAVFAMPGGQSIRVSGRMLDGDGQPVTDGLIEIWQCDAHGRIGGAPAPGGRDHSDGFGRFYMDSKGEYVIDTVMPAVLPGSAGAPHIAVIVFARGLLKHLYTRMYFDGVAANAADPVLLSVPAQRRSSLIARRSPEDPSHYLFDIRLAGEGETVFFSY